MEDKPFIITDDKEFENMMGDDNLSFEYSKDNPWNDSDDFFLKDDTLKAILNSLNEMKSDISEIKKIVETMV